jgi:DNA polymerase-3 subunit epsilon
MLYAIVDIETTGNHASGNGITEIAIVIHDGKQILDCYDTLINPRAYISRFVQSLTGITNEMVRHAPVFEDVADQIFDLLQDKIFVAHNVGFDHALVKKQLEMVGYSLEVQRLCTIRLSRRIIPGLPSYSLGKLCHQLGICHTQQHRAAGDAMATAQLFTWLAERDINNMIPEVLNLS